MAQQTVMYWVPIACSPHHVAPFKVAAPCRRPTKAFMQQHMGQPALCAPPNYAMPCRAESQRRAVSDLMERPQHMEDPFLLVCSP